MERIFRALGDRNRLRIVLILDRGPLNVSEMAGVLHLSQSNVSHHLKTLLDAGIVKRQGRSGWVYYSLERTDGFVAQILQAVLKGKGRTDSRSADMEELARCYETRRVSSKKFFDNVAGDWSEISGLLPEPDSYMDQVIRLLGNPDNILEIGCGTGKMLLKLATISDRVLGVDNSAKMLESARNLIAETGMTDKIEVRLGDAEHLPLGDKSVDAVFMHMVLHHAGEPCAVLKETERVMKDEGRCVVVELTRHESEKMRQVHGDLWPGFEPDEMDEMTDAVGLDRKQRIRLADGGVFAVMCVRKEQ